MSRRAIQLFSVGPQLESDLAGTLAQLSAIGATAVEAYGVLDRAPQLAAGLSDHGLSAPSVHVPLTSPQHLHFAPAFDAAATLGASLVIEPYVPAEKWRDRDDILITAERLNHAADAARAWGLTVGYHNHSPEFHHSFAGLSGYQVLVGALHPDVVLEVDCYWAHVAGQDLGELIDELGDRVRALHIKDGRPVQDAFRSDPIDLSVLAQTDAGNGHVPLALALQHAPADCLAIVEFDAYPGDIFRAMADALAFLGTHGVR
ncbi:MAG: sugar phosphate isomerase/epimerase family protein [Beutenbergiaceae bacterium]